jgi:hypothetical protein
MTKKSGLDAHIVKKYASLSTISTDVNNTASVNDPDKIWGTLGVMAMMNLASQHIRRGHAAA